MNNRLFAFLALLLSIFIFFVYAEPIWSSDIAKNKVAIESNTQALAAAQKYTERENKLIAERDAIDPAKRASLETLLPNTADNVQMVLDLNALAAQSGLTLSSIDVAGGASGAATREDTGGLDGSEAVNPVSSLDIALSVSGTYSAFQRFLEGVEKSQRLVDVRDLTVTGATTGLYTYQMTLRIYWLR